MCHSRNLHHKINRLHEKCQRIIYNDKTLSFEEFLTKGGSVSTHHKNLQKLVVESYKIVKRLSSEIMNEVFQF